MTVNVAYCHIRNHEDAFSLEAKYLADALRDTLARALKAEFWLEHDEGGPYDTRHCKDCGPKKNWDKHHGWKDAQWRAEADRQLRGE